MIGRRANTPRAVTALEPRRRPHGRPGPVGASSPDAPAGAQFWLGKSFSGFGPTGPWLVTPDEFDDPDDLALSCRLNGEVVQSSRTSDLIFSVGEIIERISAVTPMLPGDLVFTGTPSGVGMGRTPPRYLAPGDVRRIDDRRNRNDRHERSADERVPKRSHGGGVNHRAGADGGC